MYMGVCIIHHLAGVVLTDDGESKMRYKNEEKITWKRPQTIKTPADRQKERHSF